MDDRTMMENLLNNVKGQCNLLLNGAMESGTANVHSTFKSALTDSVCIQNEIYSKMAQKGWYSPQPAQNQQITQTKQKFSQQS